MPTVEHWCAGRYEPGVRYMSETRMLAYAPTGTPGIEVAACGRCGVAWVRAVHL